MILIIGFYHKLDTHWLERIGVRHVSTYKRCIYVGIYVCIYTSFQLLTDKLISIIVAGILEIVQNDRLIRCYGEHQLLRLGEKPRPTEINNIRGKLRSIARLLVLIRRASSSTYDLSTYFEPRYFDNFVEATRELAKGNVQLAIAVGAYVKQLCYMRVAHAVKTFDEEAERYGEQFLKLYMGQWSKMVSSAASRKQKLRRIVTKELLPKSVDLVQFASWLKEEVSRQLKRLTDYVRFVKLVMSALILFNSRRPMEIEEIKVDDFKKSLKVQEEPEEIVQSLSPEEKVLVKR